MKIFIKTYGCQANINDSEILAGSLIAKGHTIVSSENQADKIIVNTCAVKNKTQSKILHYLKKYQDKNMEIGGCLPKSFDLKKRFPQAKIIDTINTEKLNKPILRTHKETAIIQICQGCLNSCTFCATKPARGTLKSYEIGAIKRQFQTAVNQGAKKIYLTSQDNGAYGQDIGSSLPELLEELVSISGNYQIRIGMMNPWHLRKIFQSLLKVMESEKIQKFLHIPVQSGSERVLKHMKRIHSAKEFEEFVKIFRSKFPFSNFPKSTIATDIIVGYPTETDEDFQQTIELIKKTHPDVLNISSFSSRPRTPASKLKQLPSEKIKQRTKQLDDLYQSYRKTNSPA